MEHLNLPSVLSTRRSKILEHLSMLDLVCQRKYYPTFVTPEEEQLAHMELQRRIAREFGFPLAAVPALQAWKKRMYRLVNVKALNVNRSFHTPEEEFVMWCECLTDHTLRSRYWLRSALTSRKVLFPDRNAAFDWATTHLHLEDEFPDPARFEKVPPLPLEPPARPADPGPKTYVLSHYEARAQGE